MATDDPANENIETLIEREIESRIHDVVRSAVSKEEEHKYRQIKWIMATVGIVGFGTFGTLANFTIEKTVEERIEKRTNNITDSLQFVKFYTITTKLDLGTSFSREDHDAVMAYLRLAAKQDKMRESKDFISALFLVTKAFASANQAAALDEIFRLYEREILTSATMVEALLHHYGQDIIQRGSAPAHDLSKDNFEKLERAAARNTSELALAYRIIYSFTRSSEKKDKSIIDLINRIPLLDKEDIARCLFEILIRSRVENWQTHPSPDGRAFEQIVRKFLTAYLYELSVALRVEQKIIKEIADHGIDTETSQHISNNIASDLTQKQKGG